MRQGKSFIEILADELRKEIRNELAAELANEIANERVQNSRVVGEHSETWLAAHVEKSVFVSGEFGVRAYQKNKLSKKQPSSTPPAQNQRSSDRPIPDARSVSTPEQLLAAALLERHSGCLLHTSFTIYELKSVWKKAALKTHPDRFNHLDHQSQARMGQLFSELAIAYRCLSGLFDQKLAHAA